MPGARWSILKCLAIRLCQPTFLTELIIVPKLLDRGLFRDWHNKHSETIVDRLGWTRPLQVPPARCYPPTLAAKLPVADSRDLYLNNVLFTQMFSQQFGIDAGKLDTLDGDANAYAESHSFPTRRFSQRRSPQERFPTRRRDVAWSFETRASHCLISWPSIVRRNLEQSWVGRIWPRPADWIARRARGPNKRNLGFQSEYRPGTVGRFRGFHTPPGILRTCCHRR